MVRAHARSAECVQDPPLIGEPQRFEPLPRRGHRPPAFGQEFLHAASQAQIGVATEGAFTRLPPKESMV